MKQYSATTSTYLAQNGLRAVKVKNYLSETIVRYVNDKQYKALLAKGRIIS